MKVCIEIKNRHLIAACGILMSSIAEIDNERLEVRIRRRAYYQKNREKCIAQQMAYYWRNHDVIRKKQNDRWRKDRDNETENERANRLDHERELRKLRKHGIKRKHNKNV